VRNLKEKRLLVLITTILALLASITSIHEISAYQAEENLIRDKFNPPFAYDYLHNLSISNPEKIMSANVWLVENEERTGMNTAQLKQHAMEILSTQHNAEISYCPDTLPFISIMVAATEIKKIAAYESTNRITIDGPFVRTHLCLDVSVPSIRTDDVWNLDYDGSNITIAIIDTGINQSHPDLDDLDDDPSTSDPKVILEQDFTGEGITADLDGHGTHVAGIAAGTGAASNGMYKGVAPKALLLEARIRNSASHTEVTWAENAIAWAVDNEADIISYSFGHIHQYHNGTHWVQIRTDGTYSPSPAADAAVAQGVIFVACAGNYDSVNPNGYIEAPGDAFNVITVGASNDSNTEDMNDDTIHLFSSRGPTGDNRIKPDVVAPGVDIMSTSAGYSSGDDYEVHSGTSVATPHVAGVAALMVQAHPEWKGRPVLVKSVIKRTARLNDNLAQLTENDRGTGIIDALQATAQPGFEMPVAPADSCYTGGWGESYYAEANMEDAYCRLEVGTTLMNGVDSYANATLKKNFVPSYAMTNPTFYFDFQHRGIMDAHKASYAYTYLNASLKLWHNGTILSQYATIIHYVSDSYFQPSTDCFHEISLTYYGELLEGYTYTIDYSFSVYEHEARADFTHQTIQASWLFLTHNANLTVRTYDLGENEKTNVDVWIDSTQYSSPVEDLIVACGDHLVEVDPVFYRDNHKYTFQHWEGGDTSNPRTVSILEDTTLRAYYGETHVGGGGCPFIYTWNGTGYVIDNNLLGDSEASGGADVEDYYRLERPLVRKEAKYSLLIKEFEQEHSYLDQVRLMAVDHESDVHVAVSPTAEILTYKNPYAPVSAIDNHGNNTLDLVETIGDSYYRGQPDDYLLVDFGNLDVSNGAKLVLRADNQFKPDKLQCVHVQVFDATEGWMDVAVLRTRLIWATEIVDLSDYLPDADGELKVRLYFTGIHLIDYVGLDTTKQDDFNLHHANLVSAIHSEEGSIKTELLESDDLYAELVPGQQIELAFTLPENSEDARTFITYVEGHYYTIG